MRQLPSIHWRASGSKRATAFADPGPVKGRAGASGFGPGCDTEEVFLEAGATLVEALRGDLA